MSQLNELSTRPTGSCAGLEHGVGKARRGRRFLAGRASSNPTLKRLRASPRPATCRTQERDVRASFPVIEVKGPPIVIGACDDAAASSSRTLARFVKGSYRAGNCVSGGLVRRSGGCGSGRCTGSAGLGRPTNEFPNRRLSGRVASGLGAIGPFPPITPREVTEDGARLSKGCSR